MQSARICKNYFKNNEAFTLVELLVTVILVAVLASYSVYYYNNTIDEGKINAAKGKLAALGGATARYFIENDAIASNGGINAATDYKNCELNTGNNRILDVIACGYAEPSLTTEVNFNFFFGRPRANSCYNNTYNYNDYTVYMTPKTESSVFPKCAYFDRDQDKVIEVYKDE